jgi:hypothetical protein
MATLNIRIQLRNDTAENWTSANPVLLKGEMGVEIDTGKTKIGNGTDNWKTLKYSGVDEDTIKGIIDNNRSAFTEVTPNEGETDAQALARVITNPKKGDMAVVVRTFVEGKQSYTAYIHDGTGFKAMDGNYSAENVYFDKDLKLTEAFGRYKPDASGSVKVPSTGQSVYSLIDDAFSQSRNPTTTQPSASVSITANSGTFEIGTKKNLTYSASLNTGAYSYGPTPTGVSATTYTATCDGKTLTGATGTFENIVADGTKKISISIAHSAGSIPKTNKGADYADGQIKAGTKTATSSQALIGVRYMFWGPMTEDVALNSANIRALAHKEESKAKTLATFGPGDNAVKVVVAVPAGRKITKVLLTSSMNADITSSFAKQTSTVSVEGAQGYAGTAYDVYVYQPASIDKGERYAITIG